MLIRGMSMREEKNNKGYSLVEMIIVLAIIAIAAGMSLLSVTVINSARAKEASITFDSEVASLITKCKNMSPNDGTNEQYAIIIYTDTNGNAKLIPSLYDSDNNLYDYDTSNEIKLSTRVRVAFSGTTYTAGNNSTKDTAFNSETTIGALSGNPVYIRFDKKGRCLSGFGKYTFYKKNGNRVATVTIRQNGSHESK